MHTPLLGSDFEDPSFFKISEMEFLWDLSWAFSCLALSSACVMTAVVYVLRSPGV
jgi:hypothetical protein